MRCRKSRANLKSFSLTAVVKRRKRQTDMFADVRVIVAKLRNRDESERLDV